MILNDYLEKVINVQVGIITFYTSTNFLLNVLIKQYYICTA